MVGEEADVSAFESFTIADAGGNTSPSPPPTENVSKSFEPSEAQSQTSVNQNALSSVLEETETNSERLESALDRVLNATTSAISLAREKNINLSTIKGSGTHGQITEADVRKVSTNNDFNATQSISSYIDIPISSMRNTIANRLIQSVNQNPHFFVAATISVSKLLKLRNALNGSSEGKYKLSVNDFLIKAASIACKKVPTVNSSWRDGFIRQFSNVDISVR